MSAGLEAGAVATLTLAPAGGGDLPDDVALLDSTSAGRYLPSLRALDETRTALERHGLRVESASRAGLTVGGDVTTFDAAFGTRVEVRRLRHIRQSRYLVHASDQAPAVPAWLPHVRQVTFPRQLYVLDGPAAVPPPLDYFHLPVPDAVARQTCADAFGDTRERGRGVSVVMIDTGLYRHPHFAAHGLDLAVVPAVTGLDTARDERGHGTGMASILLSVAPGARLTMVKAADDGFSFPVAAFQRAAALHPDVISCSWGTIGFEPHLYLEIAAAVASGVTVVFSAGNGSSDRRGALFQTVAHPEVVSVGGCTVDGSGALAVSDVSSSYASDLFPGRTCPDLCGICGDRPYAQLVLMPTEPGSLFDRENGRRDGTRPDDGWFVSSGTSAAAAHVSGLIACALAAGAERARPALMDVLRRGSVRVSAGRSFMGAPAVAEERNPAVGYGFLRGDRLRAALEHGTAGARPQWAVHEHLLEGDSPGGVPDDQGW